MPYDVRTEERPTPKIKDPKDVIVKVRYSGLCGTDLHSYRGHIKGPVGTIIGHEFVGTVVATGDNITKFSIGDDVISNFQLNVVNVGIVNMDILDNVMLPIHLGKLV